MRAPFLFFMITVISASQTVRNLAGRLTGALFNGFNLARGNFTFGGCVGGGEPAACGLIGGELTATCVEGVLTLVDAFTIPEGDPFAMVEIVVTDGNGVEFGAPITEAGGSITVNDGDGGLDFSAGDLTIIGAVVTEGCPGKSFSIIADKSSGVLEVDKSFEVVGKPDGRPSAGDTVIFTATVMNTGTGPLIGVTAVDALPVGTTLVSAVPTQGTYTDPNWNVGDVAAGTSFDLVMTVTVDPYGENPADITNTITATSDGGKESISVTAVPVDCTGSIASVTMDNNGDIFEKGGVPTTGISATGLFELLGDATPANATQQSSNGRAWFKMNTDQEIRSIRVCGVDVKVSQTWSQGGVTDFAGWLAALNAALAEAGSDAVFEFAKTAQTVAAGAYARAFTIDNICCVDGKPAFTFESMDVYQVGTNIGVRFIATTTCRPICDASGCASPVCPKGGGGDTVGNYSYEGNGDGYVFSWIGDGPCPLQQRCRLPQERFIIFSLEGTEVGSSNIGAANGCDPFEVPAADLPSDFDSVSFACRFVEAKEKGAQ